MTFNYLEQTGGFHQLDIFLVEETSNWPVVLTDQNSRNIIITPNDIPIYSNLVPDSIRVAEPKRTTDAGDRYNIDISFEYNVQSSLLDFYLEQYAKHPVVVEVCKNYGQLKLYGSDRFPLTMSYEVENGRRPEDGVITRIRITGETPQRPVYRKITLTT